MNKLDRSSLQNIGYDDDGNQKGNKNQQGPGGIDFFRYGVRVSIIAIDWYDWVRHLAVDCDDNRKRKEDGIFDG